MSILSLKKSTLKATLIVATTAIMSLSAHASNHTVKDGQYSCVENQSKTHPITVKVEDSWGAYLFSIVDIKQDGEEKPKDAYITNYQAKYPTYPLNPVSEGVYKASLNMYSVSLERVDKKEFNLSMGGFVSGQGFQSFAYQCQQ